MSSVSVVGPVRTVPDLEEKAGAMLRAQSIIAQSASVSHLLVSFVCDRL